MQVIHVTSFGYSYGAAPDDAHLVADLRDHFLNPAPHLPAHLAFPDTRVREHVLATPGINALIEALAAAVSALLTGPGEEDVVLAVGCSGGEHRAPTVAHELTERMRGRGHTVDLTHRDLDHDTDQDQEDDEEIDIDSPIAMPEGAVDFVLPVRRRSTEDSAQARARLEVLAQAWVGGFTGPQLAQALRDREGLTRPRAWIMGELRRLEEGGQLTCDDYGYWHPAT
ncbi:RapZ C-terminal domain-containing protein [Nocardiopsis dassonvillei]|uniref:RapZ C-terminal domain-containing protein n=1 Tax=Nocardiopsis dassonvillei TaxID=2014 RepID=UPI0036730777